MAKRIVGTPISVQEHRETLSATVNVEGGTTDFIIKRTLINAETEEIVSVQNLRESAPTSEVATKIQEAVTKSKENEPEPAE